MLKTTLLTTILAAATLAAPSAASADIGVSGSAGLSVSFGELPRAPRIASNTRVPGYVWVDGHWAMYRGNVYWSPGFYLPAQRGYVYQQPHWITRRNGRSIFKKGRWIKSRRGYAYQQPHWITRKNGRSIFKKGRWIKSRRGYVYRPGRYVMRQGRQVWVNGGLVRKSRVRGRHFVKRPKPVPPRYLTPRHGRRAQVPFKQRRMRDYRKAQKRNKREIRKNLAFNQ